MVDEEKKESGPKAAKESHGNIPDFLLCRITDDFMEEPVII